jgi:hypothetical protein
MNGRFVSALSPTERAHLEYLEAQAKRQRQLYGAAVRLPAAQEHAEALRLGWAARVEDDVRHEREMLHEWAGHHATGVRRGRAAAGVALTALAGLVGGAAAAGLLR